MKLVALLLGFGTVSALAADKLVAAHEQVVVRPLRWEGTATIHAGDRKIDIRVRTRIDAKGNVVSESWPVEQGEQAMRRMTIDETGGWMEHGGKREPMPKAMLEHERQQFGFYTQLQKALAAGCWPPARFLAIDGPTPTSFLFDIECRPIEARNQVVSPETDGQLIQQVFILSGQIQSNNLEWPQEIELHQNDKPYFTLTIDKFEVGAAP